MSLPGRRADGLGHDGDDEAETSSSRRNATLEKATKAAEVSYQAFRLAGDPGEKARHLARLQQLLREAEQAKDGATKHQAISMSSAAGIRDLKEPPSTRALPRSEQILLLKASYLNNFKFPPWTKSPDADEFELTDGAQAFEDAQELSLSEFQEDVLDDWKRPDEALPPPSWFPHDHTHLGPSMIFMRKIDLVQDAATDCSVVASLCAGVARAERGHSKILRSVIYPYDDGNHRPLMSKNGKYVIRLNFNGCYRKVVIDDRLPVSSTGRIIHVIDRHNPALLWPALIEKAYLKVRGGYDFPGSNSATDLWILTGWIPEQVFLQSDDLEPDRFWKRILDAFNFGDVLVTMGTGKMTVKTERELGLAGEHDYAVLDLRVVDGQRLLLIKNPWCEGTSWRGKIKERTPGDTGLDDRLADVPINDVDAHPNPVECSRDLLNADDQLSPGTFWMDLDNVIQHFESIYLNWNPGLFACRQDLHFAWDLRSASIGQKRLGGQFASLSTHPQFAVTVNRSGTIWILLWRHFRNSISAAATDQEISEGRYTIDLQGHIALATFASQGHRVLLPEKHVQKGWFVDSPQTLLKLDDSKAGRVHTIVPLEQRLAAAEHSFTLSLFSDSPLTLAEAVPRYAHVKPLAATWTKETAGGNAHSPAYLTNPQFSIHVLRKLSISLLLEAGTEDLNVHVKLLHSGGRRVQAIRNRDIVFDSKEYRRGCCVAESASLEPGQYTIICSTFERGQLGDFTLTVESSQAVHVAMLPKEGAGRLRLELSLVSFQAGQAKVAAQLVPKRLLSVYAIARQLESAASQGVSGNGCLLRISIENGRGPHRSVHTASNDGEYADCVGGVRTQDMVLTPQILRRGEGLWLVVDRMYASTDAQKQRIGVELFVDQPDALDCGPWQAWDD
ncbi:cysteine protease [Teratosphaeriaceae sp. CCFEE 6253]|nr:cysteine protease [Teratosphaeriaceae sp. CCFEE 6253]